MLEQHSFARRSLAQCAIVLASSLIAACGSGGDEPAPANKAPATSSSSAAANEPYSLTFANEANSFQVTNSEGLNVFVPSIKINAIQTGKPDVTPVYIYVETDNEVFSNVSVNSLSQTSHTVTVRANDAIFPGTYSGELTLFVCADQSCNEQLQAPQTTTYEVNYKPNDIVMRVVGEGYTTHKDFIDGYSFNVFSILPLGETTTQASFEVELYLPDNNASYSLSADVIETYSITNQSATGFTFTTPSSPAGDNQYPLEIILSDAGRTDVTIDYDVYPVDFEIFNYHVLTQTTRTTLANGDSAEVAIQVYSPTDMTTKLYEKSDCGFWFRLDSFDNTLPGFGIHSINARINTAFELAGTKTCTLVLRDNNGDDIIEFDYTLTIE